MSNERARSPDHKELVKEMLAKLGHESRPRDREVHRRQPTTAPKWVRSADRREIQTSSSRTPSRDIRRSRSASSDRRSCSRDGPPQCYSCKGYEHFDKECPSEGFYKIRPNGLPVRVRDTSKDIQQAKDKAAPSKSLNETGVAQRALGATQTMKLGVLDLPSWALEVRPVERLRQPHNLSRKISR